MDVRLAWTDCDEAGGWMLCLMCSPRDLVSIPDNMDETVQHTLGGFLSFIRFECGNLSAES